MRQSDNASRQKVENQLRKDSLESIIQKHSNVIIDEETLARIILLKKHSDAYLLILKLLNDLTNNMTLGVRFQKNDARFLYQLATGEIIWDKLRNGLHPKKWTAS